MKQKELRHLGCFSSYMAIKKTVGKGTKLPNCPKRAVHTKIHTDEHMSTENILKKNN